MLYIFPKFLLSSKECSISNYTPIWVQRKAIPVIITEDSVHFLKNPKKSPQSQFLFTKIKKEKRKKKKTKWISFSGVNSLSLGSFFCLGAQVSERGGFQ